MKKSYLLTLTIIVIPYIWNDDVYANTATIEHNVPFVMQGHDILWDN